MKTFKVENQYKDLMKRWIEDLEMNPELQGAEYLYDNGTYCCLGRLCIVAGYQNDDIEYLGEIRDNFIKIPEVFMSGHPSILMKMNDSDYIQEKDREDWGLNLNTPRKQYTFPEIAEFLKERIEYVEEM